MSDILVRLFKSLGVVVLLTFFFYRNALAAIPLSFIGFIFYKQLSKRDTKKRKELLEYQFRECILSVTTALKAGYAVENAFLESRKDMALLFGEKSLILSELDLIRRGLVLNLTLEELLKSLADRSGSEYIEQFSQVFAIAKRNGGNMSEIIQTSSDLITRQIDMRSEINTVLSGRRFEQNIMKVMPFGIVLYVGFSNRGYFDSLYGNWMGVLVMTGCLVLYLFAYFLGDKILGRLEREM